MRFFLDENLSPELTDSLRFHFRDHSFSSAYDDRPRYCGVNDIELMARLGGDRFHAVVTVDRNQLSNAGERQAVRTAGLHWVGMASGTVPGAKGQMLMTVTLLAGLPHAVDVIDSADRPMLMTLKGVEREVKQRLGKCQAL